MKAAPRAAALVVTTGVAWQRSGGAACGGRGRALAGLSSCHDTTFCRGVAAPNSPPPPPPAAAAPLPTTRRIPLLKHGALRAFETGCHVPDSEQGAGRAPPTPKSTCSTFTHAVGLGFTSSVAPPASSLLPPPPAAVAARLSDPMLPIAPTSSYRVWCSGSALPAWLARHSLAPRASAVAAATAAALVRVW